MVKRIVAISIIFIGTALSWFLLGTTINIRTQSQDSAMKAMVGQLWGQAHRQHAPDVFYRVAKQVTVSEYQGDKQVEKVKSIFENIELPIQSSDVDVDLDLGYRRKGLLWYSTYKVGFAAKYVVTNTTSEKQKVFCSFTLPTQEAIYDDFVFMVGKDTVKTIRPQNGAISESMDIDAGASETIHVSYRSQGQDQWQYFFGNGVSQVKDFNLKLKTNFGEIDFPEGSISPTRKTKLDNGWQLEWNYNNLLTGYSVGMDLPKKLNPGPWVSKVTFFAPVSLFLFFFIVFMIATVRGIKIHPMNYFFMGSGFFSFHLLLAYLVDHVAIELAFLIASVVSVFLVISYMRLVVPGWFAYFEVALAQLVYLVLFSYTFFFEHYTGLIVTVLCILTLFVMMQFTGRVDWDSVFKKGDDRPRDRKQVEVI